MKRVVLTVWLCVALPVLAGSGPMPDSKAEPVEDPWVKIRERFGSAALQEDRPVTGAGPNPDGTPDPWVRLRSVFLPFSLDEERRARISPAHADAFSRKFYAVLAPYRDVIRRASRTFDIPEAVIGAVIMAASGGDPRAAATTTSAKGLMQTIDATFARARKGLAGQGIPISGDPFDPEASILAGSWYLDRMFRRAASDGKIPRPDRQRISSWRYPLEYYYAGPGNGAKPQNKIMVFSRGQRRIIDKQAYSGKIQTWAAILKTQEV